MTKEQKENVAHKVASALTDHVNRGGEFPTQEELEQLVKYVLDQVQFT